MTKKEALEQGAGNKTSDTNTGAATDRGATAAPEPPGAFSYYLPPVNKTNAKPEAAWQLQQALDYIKSDKLAQQVAAIRAKVAEIRAQPLPEAADGKTPQELQDAQVKKATAEQKLALPYITISGTFTGRKIADLVQLTGRELSALWNPVAAGAKPTRVSGS